MRILLINPPNCGRSIPEERYGVSSMKQIFRGEPLALETLAGALSPPFSNHAHDVRIVDLKAAPEELSQTLVEFQPEIVGLTGVTCEANTVRSLARQIKESMDVPIVIGGVHASMDPKFFNVPEVDWIVQGLGKKSFSELVDALQGGESRPDIPGVGKTASGQELNITPRQYSAADLIENAPPRYDLVQRYREHYTLSSLNITVGFAATSFGCPYDCSFCCIASLTGGRYLAQGADSALRDIELLGDIPVIRLIDANFFGDPNRALCIARAIGERGINKQFVLDVRADTVVRRPDLLKAWKEVGLRAVIIGFEEISDAALARMNKQGAAESNREAIRILHEMGVTIVGDFIVDPAYEERDFDALGRYILENQVDLPMLTVLTPLPGTRLYAQMLHQITETNLDYYTLTNAVIPTKLPEHIFYERYAALLAQGHASAKV